MIGKALLAAAVAVGGKWLLASTERPVCPHSPAACFFSSDYASARSSFREAASRLDAELHRLKIADSPDLTIDVAVVPADGAPADAPTLVHLSGTHGVEAYAGSAVQLALLRGWAEEPASAPARHGVRVVLVHGVNPFGWHCNRRWNEEGADLNRNVLQETEFEALSRPGTERQQLYDTHEWLWNWPRVWVPVLDDVWFAAKAAYAITFVGMVNVKRAIVAGQYHRPDGLYYGGGPRMAASHALLLPLLRRVAVPASAAFIIDVHTGLGPYGVDSLMPPLTGKGGGDQANAAAIRAIFGQEGASEHVEGRDFILDAASPANAAGGTASAGYELTRGSTENYIDMVGKEKDGWARALSVVQEFGTLPGPLVLRGMVIERAEWVHQRAATSASGCNGTVRGAHAARDAFYVQEASWQAKIVRRGVRLAEQAVAALAQSPEVIPAM